MKPEHETTSLRDQLILSNYYFITPLFIYYNYLYFYIQQEVMPVIKEKSKTAQKKVKKGYNYLTQNNFIMPRKICIPQKCSASLQTQTSSLSFISTKSANPEPSKPRIQKKSKKNPQKQTGESRKKLSVSDKMQICECEDNPNKTSPKNFYASCCCTKIDSTGNKIKKGFVFVSQRLFYDEPTSSI